MIYICYGLTKSASTFLYQITEEILRCSGGDICRIVRPGRNIFENYFDRISTNFLERIAAKAGDRHVVLKTHGPLDPDVARLIASGELKANASFRDPREIALSMVDHGKRARKLGERPFSEIVTIADTFSAIDTQISYLRQWTQTNNVKALSYNQVCFDTKNTITNIANQIGFDLNSDHVLRIFNQKRLIGQINIACPLRYREMSNLDQNLFLKRYRDFYDDFDLHEDYTRDARIERYKDRYGFLGYHFNISIRHVRRLATTKSLGAVLP
ncbi:hypothetical protein [Rhizobium sp. SL86]|uniref:hypothetical protein n=1 Tax=Rhizobium sp. SL86 TaxID=2995148 RepID=UPI0022743226|nr:hypothetical protein [Rhizobium sp. SL86]MCY1669389.1 hypothetical protein [Rhizobium sp. SL86]